MMPLPEIPTDEWFDNPLDRMPIARESNENPSPEEEIADWFDESDEIEHEKNYASRHESSPDFEKSAEEVVTMHEKMYRIATAKYNPFAIGGSESIHDFQGGSENASSI